MDFEKLRYYKQIYESLSLNAASNELYISQPALSKSLKSMEKEVGTTLFVRNKKGLYPTNAGKIFYKNAVKILNLYNETLLSIYNEFVFSDSLTIFVPPCIAQTYFPAIMKDLCLSFKNLNLHVQEYAIDKIPELLKVPNSFVFTMGGQEVEELAQKAPEYEYILLKTEPVYAFLSKYSSLAQMKKIPASIKLDNNISFREYNTFHSFDKKYSDDNYITNFSLSQEMILTNNGVHILPIGIGTKVYTHPEIVAIPLERDINVLYGVLVPRALFQSEFSMVIFHTMRLFKERLQNTDSLSLVLDEIQSR